MRRKAPLITFNWLAAIWFAALTVVTVAAACVWFFGTARAGI